MQFIEELTLINKVAIIAAVGLIMLLLLVSARRRKAAAAPVEESAVPVAKAPRHDERAKSRQARPRRRRRKLAAEAAQAMGDAAPMAAVTPTVPGISVPAVTVAQAIEPAEAPVAEAIAAGTVSDDPYLHDAPSGDTGAFVAQPGWPSPGELASSFDPDAFDPLPEMYEPQTDDARYDQTPEAVEYDDTHAIEMPGLSTAHEVDALAEIEEWANAVEAGADSNDTDDADLSHGNWTISEPPPEPRAVAESEAIALEGIWSEPDDEPLWDRAGEAEPTSGEDVDLDTALDEDPAFAFPIPGAGVEFPVAEDSTFDLPAWADDSPSTWQATDVPEAPPAPQTAVPAGWSGGMGAQSLPVVLDLAGLAASGQSLELVIEPSDDGHGVRLRFGAPGVPHADARVSPEGKAEIDDDVAVAKPETTVWDVPFLAGVAPVDEPRMVADRVEPAEAHLPDRPEHIVVETAEPAAPEAILPEGPAQDAPEPAITYVDQASPSTFEAPMRDDDAFAFDLEPTGPSNASAAMDADDDPARILADIRARLAALDAQR